MSGTTDPTAVSARTRAKRAPLLSLEIVRGRTQFRSRPVWENRFLIGSGAACHLRLGGDDMPPLHSILVVDSGDIWLDAVADVPPLYVNGEIERSVRLADGDTLRVGTFEFVVRRTAVAAVRETQMPSQPVAACNPEAAIVEAAEVDPSSLSASELVALLERDEQLVEEFEASRSLGAAALLNAIRQRTELPQIAGRIPVQPSEAERRASVPAAAGLQIEAVLLDELEEVIQRLNNFSNELDRRSERLSPRELSYSEAATALLDAQKALDAQLQRVLARLTSLDSSQPGAMRASA